MIYKIKNRHRLKKKDIRNLLTEISKTFIGNFFNEKSSVEIGEINGINIILVDNEPNFMYYNNNIFFTLYGIQKYNPQENFVIVDMGTVKFVTNGADVMAPGIKDADKKIKKGNQVWICDERYHKPLAIGIAEMDGKQMISENNGKSIIVIHYVGDNLWNFFSKKNNI